MTRRPGFLRTVKTASSAMNVQPRCAHAKDKSGLPCPGVAAKQHAAPVHRYAGGMDDAKVRRRKQKTGHQLQEVVTEECAVSDGGGRHPAKTKSAVTSHVAKFSASPTIEMRPRWPRMAGAGGRSVRLLSETPMRTWIGSMSKILGKGPQLWRAASMTACEFVEISIGTPLG